MTTDPGEADPAHGTSGNEYGVPTVLCPKGHVNAWNYKFCGQCGTPIGVTSWPEDELASAPPVVPSQRPLAVVIGIVAIVLVAAAIGAGVFVLTRSESDLASGGLGSLEVSASAPPTSVAPQLCQEAPLMDVESMDLTSAGLEIQAAFLSPCGDDVESNSKLIVTVAEGHRDVAAATFDFSADPLTLERGAPARRTLVFPHGMYWRTPSMLTEAPTLVAARDGEGRDAAAAAGGGPSTMIAAGPAAPAHGSVDGVAKAVLAELLDADSADVGQLTLAWVPQISSKKVGLVAAGKTWSNADILADHLDLRQRYAGARLLWSGDWTTFSDPNFWVTVVGPAYRFPQGANNWCDDQDFALDDCFAKFISSLFGVPGTTVYRK